VAEGLQGRNVAGNRLSLLDTGTGEPTDCPDQICGVTSSYMAWAKFKLPFPVGIRQTAYMKAKEIQGRGCGHLFI